MLSDVGDEPRTVYRVRLRFPITGFVRDGKFIGVFVAFDRHRREFLYGLRVGIGARFGKHFLDRLERINQLSLMLRRQHFFPARIS